MPQTTPVQWFPQGRPSQWAWWMKITVLCWDDLKENVWVWKDLLKEEDFKSCWWRQSHLAEEKKKCVRGKETVWEDYRSAHPGPSAIEVHWGQATVALWANGGFHNKLLELGSINRAFSSIALHLRLGCSLHKNTEPSAFSLIISINMLDWSFFFSIGH